MNITINQVGADSFTVRNSATQDAFLIRPEYTVRDFHSSALDIGLTNEEIGKVLSVITAKRPGVVAAHNGIPFKVITELVS